MDGIDYFKIIARYYDRAMRNYDTSKLVNYLDIQPPMRLLDVGGGTGRVANLLNNRASKTVVVDRSQEMLKYANHKVGIMPVCSLSEKMPFPSNYFERIIIVDALHHVQNQAQSAKEMWRVLAPDGRIVIEEIDIRKFKGKLIQLMETVLLMKSRFLLPEQIIEIFSGYKFNAHVDAEGLNTWIVLDKI